VKQPKIKKPKAKRRKQKIRPEWLWGVEGGHDETFAYIAGFTGGGAAFGVTWEERKAMENSPQTIPVNFSEDNEMPDDFDFFKDEWPIDDDSEDDEIPF
jgi:hypothetical protein